MRTKTLLRLPTFLLSSDTSHWLFGIPAILLGGLALTGMLIILVKEVL